MTTKIELGQFIGTEHYYAHWLGIKYTDGVKYLAGTAGAYWLIDIIASHQPAVKRKLARMNEGNFQTWTLEKIDNGYRVRCDNGNGVYLASQRVGYTDFPQDLMPFSMFLVDGVLMLKSEY